MLIAALALGLAVHGDTTRKKTDSLPLVTTREVTFETSEGTWLSLDVSPDGRTIAFELLGDIYTMPITGGRATAITTGRAFDSQPRWSPDGKRIVFLSDRDGGENVWTMDPDGSKTTAVSKADNNLYASPVWTPDGQYIVVSRTNAPLGSSYQLWMFHKDGGPGVSLTKDDKGLGALGSGRGTNINSLGAAFGPDGRYLWYARKKGGFGYNIDITQWQLAILDRSNGKIFPQTDIYGSAMRPMLSPDGHWLVYGVRHDAETGLRIRDLSSGDERWLRYPVQRDDQESRFTRDLMPGSAFTPDSRSLVTTWGGRIWKVSLTDTTATEIPFIAPVQLDLGPLVQFPYRADTGDILAKQVREASLSPDGKSLVFSALDRLYRLDLPNGTPKRLTTDTVHEQHPAWSPDGKTIAYITWTTDGGNIQAVGSAGGKTQRLTTSPAFYQYPVYAPDGQRIVALRGPRDARVREGFGPGYDLIWLPARGGAAQRVTPINPNGRPHFSRDPNRIYIYDAGEGLLSMRFDGTDRQAIIKITGFTVNAPAAEPNPADEILISPDSQQVLALVNNYVYLVTLPMTGQLPIAISIADPAAAAFPVKRLTKIGGDFIGWAADGRSVTWSLGRSFFRYEMARADSLDKLKAQIDSIRADSLKTLGDKADSATKVRVDSLAKLPAYEATRLDIAVRVPRDVPRGTVVLAGARIITMKGDEVIEQGDIVITDNRIVCVAASGCARPAGARVIDVTGKTIMPGIVDIHAHPWPTWGVHETQVWKYLANLAFGVTTTRDPQTSTTDVLTYADLVETGDLIGPRIYHTGPGVFGRTSRSLRDPGRRPQRPQALQRVLQHEHDQAVHGRQPEAAAVGHHGREGAGPDADHRGRPRLQDEPDLRDGRLPRPRARPADHAAVQGCGAAVRQVGDHLHPDAARLLRRALQRELFLRALRHPRHAEGPALLPSLGDRWPRRAPALVPRQSVRLYPDRRGCPQSGRSRRQGRARWTWPDGRTGRPLGAVGAGVGWDEAA